MIVVVILFLYSDLVAGFMCVCVHMRVRMCVHVSVSTRVCTCTHMCVCVHTCVCMRV